MHRAGVFVCAVVVALAALTASASAGVTPYGTDDYRGFHDVLPSGTNGLDQPGGAGGLHGDRHATGPQRRPARPCTRDLVYATPGLTSDELGSYYKDSTFGVKADDVERTYSPRSDVTIVRDKGFGVPHIYGDDARRRDVRRAATRPPRTGCSSSTSCATSGAPSSARSPAARRRTATSTTRSGGSPRTPRPTSSARSTSSTTSTAPTARPLQDRRRRLRRRHQPVHRRGAARPAEDAGRVRGDRQGARARPVEGHRRHRHRLAGRRDLRQGRRPRARRRPSCSAPSRSASVTTLGTRALDDFRSADDPEAPTTVHGQVASRTRPAPRTPRAGQRRAARRRLGQGRAGGRLGELGAGRRPLPGVPPLPQVGALEGIGALPEGDVQRAARLGAPSRPAGHPLAVFGPAGRLLPPQILMEQDVHAPGIDARGAAFPGVNVYVQLGHGRDYAWSATSAGQDIIDTFAVDLCNPDGSTPTLDSNTTSSAASACRSRCSSAQNSWTPNAGRPDAGGLGDAARLAHQARARDRAAARSRARRSPTPSLRSTYFHEVDSALGFAAFNDPDQIDERRTTSSAPRRKIGYTFNWFYVDDKDIAYFNSGNNPVRARNTDPLLPDPRPAAVRVAQLQPGRAHGATTRRSPSTRRSSTSSTSRAGTTSRRTGYAASDSNIYSSIYRSQPLDDRIQARHRRRQEADADRAWSTRWRTPARSTCAATRCCRWALKVLGTPADPRLARRRDQAQGLGRPSGAHRRRPRPRRRPTSTPRRSGSWTPGGRAG